MTVSKAYRDQLRTLHADPDWGNEGRLWLGHVQQLSAAVGGVSTILDYGCGKGTFAAGWGNIASVREYDPGIPGKDSAPEPADLVVCTDVLEHVEPEHLGAVLSHIHGLALKGAFLVIACRPARAALPDGRNAHLIVQPPRWWIAKVKAMGWSSVMHKTQRRGRAVIMECIK